MASLVKPCQVIGQCRHFSTSLQRLRKPNIQKPRVPGMERRILNAITVPVFPSDKRPLPQKCFDEEQERKMKYKSEVNDAFDAFRVGEARRMFENHKLVAICHALPVPKRDFEKLRATLFLSGFNLTFARKDLALEAIQNTRFVNLEPYLTSDNVYIVSEEVKLPELVKALRKTPSLALLGGLVENQILSRDQIMNAAKLPPLDIMRGELLTILSASASKTSRLIGRHAQDFSSSLTQLVKQGSEGERSGAEGQSESHGVTSDGGVGEDGR